MTPISVSAAGLEKISFVVRAVTAPAACSSVSIRLRNSAPRFFLMSAAPPGAR
jgi:hypothetical protein